MSSIELHVKSSAQFPHPEPSANIQQTCLDASLPNRRHSLPHHFLPPGLWSSNTSTASLIETDTSVAGEHTFDKPKTAHRISALRQLNGIHGSHHRYVKSTGASNTTFSQPVIVRTYSAASRASSQQREPSMTKELDMGIITLPPVEAFSFHGIMESIQTGVTEDLERIAEICARSRYSLSNQYEVHMPPHGEGFFQSRESATGPTLEAIESDDEQVKQVTTRSRHGRRRSMAYGTLETIMSSSRSSEEDSSKKKSAAALAGEVRGRTSRKHADDQTTTASLGKSAPAESTMGSQKQRHIRPRSATFASLIINNAQGQKGYTNDGMCQHTSPSLVSEPARPQTSRASENATDLSLDLSPLGRRHSVEPLPSPKPTLLRNESDTSYASSRYSRRGSLLRSFSSWMSWTRPLAPIQEGVVGRHRSGSNAEGSLRDLLRATGDEEHGDCGVIK